MNGYVISILAMDCNSFKHLRHLASLSGPASTSEGHLFFIWVYVKDMANEGQHLLKRLIRTVVMHITVFVVLITFLVKMNGVEFILSLLG
jgi:hypothetical protein